MKQSKFAGLAACSLLALSLSTGFSFAQTSEGSQVQAEATKSKTIAIVLFDDFETLDVFGPVQMWGRLDDHRLVTVSETGDLAMSSQGLATVVDYSFADAPQFDIIMVPGGGGTRREVDNPAMLDFLRKQSAGTEWTTSVCTGSALLARAGLLDGRQATSNKRAWAFATSQDGDVVWQGNARWVEDGKFITSSGVSAGTDMALALVEKLYGRARADRIAHGAEYVWNDDAGNDPFKIEDPR